MMQRKLLGLLVASSVIALSGQAFSDSFYFRSKGSPAAVEAPPTEPTAPTAAMAMSASIVRSGSAITGAMTTSLPGAAWTIQQSPVSPSLNLTVSGGAFSGVAPSVDEEMSFSLSATAVLNESSAPASATLSVHPVLSIAGGPSAQISGHTNEDFPTQPAFTLSGLIGDASYELMSGASSLDIGTQCPGLSFSASTGVVSGKPTETCEVSGLQVRVKDSFDDAQANGYTFGIKIDPSASNAIAWGGNSFGELGDETNTNSFTPVSVSGGKRYIQIEAGDAFACGLVQDGSVECWGRNSAGQLGNGTTTNSNSPVQVIGITHATAISVGAEHSCAVDSGGAKCWGKNSTGQLGNNSTSNSSVAVQVSGMAHYVTGISSGETHTCAIFSGQAWCWGSNGVGQLGIAGGSVLQPSNPATGLSSNVTAIASGGSHTCAVSDGAMYCWGFGGDGALGNGTSNRPAPTLVPGMSGGISKISAGHANTCAIRSGTAYCWGYGNYGAVGNGGTGNMSSPQTVSINGPIDIYAGWNGTCAVGSAGVYCWGVNSKGQVGDGSTAKRLAPYLVQGLPPGITKVAIGSTAAVAW